MSSPDIGSSPRRDAPAKVNLTLRVVGRREDGYHLLNSLVAFTAFGDSVAVDIAGARRDETLMDGPFAERVDGPNLVDRARDAFRAATGWAEPVRIEVVKRIPTGAGLGGGSADAAATLRLLNQAAGEPLDEPALARIRGSVLEGIGELVRPIEVAPSPILLIHPGVSAATPAVFRAFDQHYSRSESSKASLSTNESLWHYLRQAGGNDLEPAAISVVPAIGNALDQLRRHLPEAIVRMSGSGSACFAIGADQAALDTAAERLRADNPGWWIERTRLRAAAPETEGVLPPA
jgi:4-diphosphocytidyl-2-C-methyl-D-erythritol kinase